MPAPNGDPRTYAGRIRVPGGDAAPGTVTLAEAGAVLARDGDPPRTIAYRDLAIVAIADGVGLLATGGGPADERWLLEQFGAATGPLVAALREARLRQRLEDALVVLPGDEPIDLVEYGILPAGAAATAVPAAEGVAQLAVDGWGATLAPIDERRPARRIRRADIERVDLLPPVGGVRVTAREGGFDLLRLGPAATRHRARLADLPAAAHRDAAAILGVLLPDLGPSPAGRAAAALVDGRPASPDDLGEAWAPVERGVLNQPVFAASYGALLERAGGEAALRWFALAPVRPGAADPYKAWFLVGLPGNLVALELVSEGAHATYCFRALPRAAYAGGADRSAVDPAAAAAAVARVSAALIDARFLREPIALPEVRLAQPEGLRYRLALAAIPSLAVARADFVARLVHRDEAAWAAALDDLIAWHGACRDDAATWPGRASQEAQVDDAAGAGGPTG